MKRIITLALAMIMLIMSALCLFACASEPDENDDDGVSASDTLVGVVTDGVKNNRFSLQTSEGADYVVNVGEPTVVIGAGGAVLSFADIKLGSHVRIYYNGMVTRSIPPQVSATRVEILNTQTAKSGGGLSETYSMRAEVLSLYDGMLVRVISSDYTSGDYYFHISDETTVYDNTGAVVAFSYVKVGDIVSVTYGNAVTLSLPPQTTAIRIVVE